MKGSPKEEAARSPRQARRRAVELLDLVGLAHALLPRPPLRLLAV
ncbi:MAG: hypothetical protein ACLQRH_11145 [Acidimicrobiales bacterium]